MSGSSINVKEQDPLINVKEQDPLIKVKESDSKKELAPKKGVIYFARHAESRWNAAPPADRGEALRDADLSGAGLQSLMEFKAAVSTLGCKTVYCSPLTRALRTAAATGLNISIHPCLREIRRDWSDVGREHAAICVDFPGIKIPGLLADWWIRPDCKVCTACHECVSCVIKRCAEIRELMRTQAEPVLFIGHSDLLMEMFQWDAKNCEVKAIAADT